MFKWDKLKEETLFDENDDIEINFIETADFIINCNNIFAEIKIKCIKHKYGK